MYDSESKIKSGSESSSILSSSIGSSSPIAVKQQSNQQSISSPSSSPISSPSSSQVAVLIVLIHHLMFTKYIELLESKDNIKKTFESSEKIKDDVKRKTETDEINNIEKY